MSKWIWNKKWFVEESFKMLINKNNNNKNYFETDDFDFIEKEYTNILKKILENYKHKEINIGSLENFLKNNDVPRIIFYIQYLAGSKSLYIARFIGYSNLSSFVAAHLGKEFCGHIYELEIIERLQYLFRFDIYEKDVYINCISKIVLASLMDHYNDIEEDVLKNKKHNNPFLCGNIDKNECNIFKQNLIDIIENGI